MWRNTVTLDCAWKGETWKEWWVILLWYHCATRCHCSFYQHNIGKKWNIPKLFFSLLFYQEVVEEGVSSFQHSDLWAGVTMHPWTHSDVLFFNWFLWASAAAWWILKLQSTHSSFSVATKIQSDKMLQYLLFSTGASVLSLGAPVSPGTLLKSRGGAGRERQHPSFQSTAGTTKCLAPVGVEPKVARESPAVNYSLE